MNIIIQGCDKTGKTTLSNKLKLRYGFKYKKINQPTTTNVLAEYNMIFDSAINDNYIFDRFHIGQNVYGPLYRNTKPIDLIDLQNKMVKNGDIIILCYDNVDNIIKKFIDQKQTFSKQKDVQIICNKFLYYTSYSILPVVYYNMNFGFEQMSNFNMLLDKLVESRKK